jgi:hypothetical protein
MKLNLEGYNLYTKAYAEYLEDMTIQHVLSKKPMEDFQLNSSLRTLWEYRFYQELYALGKERAARVSSIIQRKLEGLETEYFSAQDSRCCFVAGFFSAVTGQLFTPSCHTTALREVEKEGYLEGQKWLRDLIFN